MIVDLSSLPAPSVKEPLDFEKELQRKKDRLKAIYPEWDADVESDASVKLLEVSAYSSVNERQRVNDAALSVMLAWMSGDDLDVFAANFNLTRNILQEADDNAEPPLEEIKESDDALKERCLLAWHAITNAGTQLSYTAHARAAHVKVKGAVAIRIAGGQTKTYVLSYDGTGKPTEEVLDAVKARLSRTDVRQLCSTNEVAPAHIHLYSINATLNIRNTTIKDALIKQAIKNTQAYVNKAHQFNSLVSESALKAAMHIEGVLDVDLGDFANIATDDITAPFCESITITSKE